MNFSKLIPKKRGDWLILILIGVLLMIIAIPTGSSGEKQKSSKQEDADTAVFVGRMALSPEEYANFLEQKLADTLSQMRGVGQVKVMITLKDDGESVVDKDKKKNDKSYEETTVLTDQNQDSVPYVTKERLPSVEGVVVVAEGAQESGVRMDIAETVQALFSVEAHKIKVLAKG